MAWLFLFIAGVLEMVWAVSLKFTRGFSQLIPSVITIAGMIGSFFFPVSGPEAFAFGYILCHITLGIVGLRVMG